MPAHGLGAVSRPCLPCVWYQGAGPEGSQFSLQPLPATLSILGREAGTQKQSCAERCLLDPAWVRSRWDPVGPSSGSRDGQGDRFTGSLARQLSRVCGAGSGRGGRGCPQVYLVVIGQGPGSYSPSLTRLTHLAPGVLRENHRICQGFESGCRGGVQGSRVVWGQHSWGACNAFLGKPGSLLLQGQCSAARRREVQRAPQNPSFSRVADPTWTSTEK